MRMHVCAVRLHSKLRNAPLAKFIGFSSAKCSRQPTGADRHEGGTKSSRARRDAYGGHLGSTPPGERRAGQLDEKEDMSVGPKAQRRVLFVLGPSQHNPSAAESPGANNG